MPKNSCLVHVGLLTAFASGCVAPVGEEGALVDGPASYEEHLVSGA